MTPTSLAPKSPEEELTLVQPLREPIRPYWSITQLVATKAKPCAKSNGESWVLSPKNPGALMLNVWIG